MNEPLFLPLISNTYKGAPGAVDPRPGVTDPVPGAVDPVPGVTDPVPGVVTPPPVLLHQGSVKDFTP